MTSFSAIVKLTCRSAVRSHVFQFLLFVLLLGVLLVPNTIKGDGTAYGYMQVSLEYCFTFITVMLMLSGVWLGCQTMTSFSIRAAVRISRRRSASAWKTKCSPDAAPTGQNCRM